MNLKIEMYPAFTNECNFEIKGSENNLALLIIKSSNPDTKDKGEAYYGRLNNSKKFDTLIQKLLHFNSNPSPKKLITIADGIIFNIKFISEHEHINCTLKSIQKDSVEMKFIHCLFELVLETIIDKGLVDYLNKVKSDFL